MLILRHAPPSALVLDGATLDQAAFKEDPLPFRLAAQPRQGLHSQEQTICSDNRGRL